MEPWLQGATLAGLRFERGFGDEAIERLLDGVRAERATVVVAESELSTYLVDEEFPAQLDLANRVADRAHARGLRVVWSLPSLKIRTIDGQTSPRSMAKEHPAWLQIPPVMEDDTDNDIAWLCPEGGARSHLLSRVKWMAATRIDGLVVEGPEFVPSRGPEEFQCPEYRAKFWADTGFAAPGRVDCEDGDQPMDACAKLWSAPAWRAWIAHRHDELDELQRAIVRAAQEGNPYAQTIVRIRTTDSNDALERGLDGARLGKVPGLTRLWEIPTVSRDEGMRRASPDDWVNQIALVKFARGADRGGATWAMSYGNLERDATRAMGILFASQASPVEARVPFSSVSVGSPFRARMFAWAHQNSDALSSARVRGGARVAVLHSSSSRDYVDWGYGAGLFSEITPAVNSIGGRGPGPDPSWWSDEPRDSVAELEHVGEVRGLVKALVHLHVPFAIEPLRGATASELEKYAVVVAPGVASLSDAEASTLREYTRSGGQLVITGVTHGALDESGNARPELALHDVLGFGKADLPEPESSTSRAFGRGAVHLVRSFEGRKYLRYGDTLALERLSAILRRGGEVPLTTDASPSVYLDVGVVDPGGPGDGGALVLHAVNLADPGASGSAPPRTFKIALDVPRAPARVWISSPSATPVDADLPFTSPEEGRVAFEVTLHDYALVRIELGTRAVARAPLSSPPSIAASSDVSGYAGHSLTLTGKGLGFVPGKVSWGQESCTVTSWSPEKIVAYLPDAAPGTNPITVVAGGASLSAGPFTVVPPGITPTLPMKAAFDFIKAKMRSRAGGVYTNFKDQVDDPKASEVYPYGHHQTAEHMGLMLWVAAALLDHQAFEESYQFLLKKMVSPRRDVVNWAIDKLTNAPMLQQDEPGAPLLNSNAPLDDLRVVKGLVSGWTQWKDERYLWLARRIGHGLHATSSTGPDITDYPGGLVAYAYNWPEEAGLGHPDVDVVPVNYADLWTMKWLSDHDPRWTKLIDGSIRLMERALIPSSGQFYNSYLSDTRSFSGDFEYRDTIAGQKVKSIQSLWIAIHLARVGRTAPAQKALDFYKSQYTRKGRISEYLNYDGTDCTERELADTLVQGEARIYAQVARLAYYLGDRAFGDKVISEKILTDQVPATGSPVAGSIGKSSTDDGDAEAWNTLESLAALALQQGSPVMSHVYR